MSDCGANPSDDGVGATPDGRRSFIKKAAVGVGVAWATPTILQASPAWAQEPGSLLCLDDSSLSFAATSPVGAAWDFDPADTNLDCSAALGAGVYSSDTDVAIVGEGPFFVDPGSPLSANIGLADAGTGPQCDVDLGRTVSGQLCSYYVYAGRRRRTPRPRSADRSQFPLAGRSPACSGTHRRAAGR
jgi:hypothetical protein